MNILVTGASGFIGNHLIRELSGEHRFVCPDRKLLSCNSEELRKILEAERIHVVIHLASHFLRSHDAQDISPLMESNIHLGTRILEAIAHRPETWFVNTGTAMQHTGPEENRPWNLYAATKEAFSGITKWYGNHFGISHVTLKLFDTYGPDDSRDKVLNQIHQAALSEKELSLSPGEQILDVVYISDVVSAYRRILSLISSAPEEIRSLDFGVSGERFSLKEIVRCYEESTGRKVPAVWGARPYRQNEIFIPWASFRRIPSHVSMVPLSQGLRLTYGCK